MAKVLVIWRGDLYQGTTREIAPNVIKLEKDKRPLPGSVKPSKSQPLLTANSTLNLNGCHHLLRRINSYLTHLTQDQERYLVECFSHLIPVEKS